MKGLILVDCFNVAELVLSLCVSILSLYGVFILLYFDFGRFHAFRNGWLV